MTSITSEQVNYLIYRYLQETGFIHSAYCFGQESFISKADIKSANVPPGALIALLQKGLHYVSIETHLKEDGSEVECNRPFTLLESHVCEQRHSLHSSKSMVDDVDDDFNGNSTNHDHALNSNMLPSVRGVPAKEPAIPVTLAPPLKAANEDNEDMNLVIDSHTKKTANTGGKSKKKRLSRSMDIVDESTPTAPVWNDEDVMFIRDGLRPNITNISCSPSSSLQLISTGTGDGWLQLWMRDDVQKQFSLTQEIDFSASKDITALNWRSDGMTLAAASMDGSVRLLEFSVVDGSTGVSCNPLPSNHAGPVFSVKWSPSGTHLLTGGMDKVAAVWQDSSLKRSFNYHSGPILDVDWRTDESFATCSVDHKIAVYNNWLDNEEPVQVFIGHEDEVNAISWDPTRTVLASCSDDSTARLWRSSQSSAVHILADHRKEIYSVRWSPVESRAGSSWLATASLDTTVRLWDAESGKCVRTLAKHSDAAFALAFSPDGDYLATGARDSVVHIWSLRDGIVVRSFHGGPGGVFDLSWTCDGRSLIASSTNDVCVYDMPSGL